MHELFSRRWLLRLKLFNGSCSRSDWIAKHRKHMLHERSYSVSVELPSINEVFPGLQQLYQDREETHVV